MHRYLPLVKPARRIVSCVQWRTLEVQSKCNAVSCAENGRGVLFKTLGPLLNGALAAMILGVLTFALPANSYSQLQTNWWYFGNRAGLTFMDEGPIADSSGMLISGENCTSYSDPCTGELLLYSNGRTIWDSQHQIIVNGDGLLGAGTTSQGVLLIPSPESPDKMFCFTAGPSSSGIVDFDPRVAVSVVERAGESRNWRVSNKNIVVLDSTAEKLAATQTCDGRGYWVAAHHIRLNTFFILRLDETGNYTDFQRFDGIGHQPQSNVEIEPLSNWHYRIGGMKFSPDGKYLCLVSNRANFVELFRFDNKTGELSDPILLSNVDSEGIKKPYSCAFSSNSKILYVSRGFDRHLSQYDLSTYDYQAIRNSLYPVYMDAETISFSNEFHAMQLARDGRIYYTDIDHLDVIANPNEAGAACKYLDSAVYLMGRGTNSSLPSFVDSWLATPPDAGLECAKPHVKFSLDTLICAGQYLQVENLTRRNPQSWQWTFEGGIPASFEGANPPAILFPNPGMFFVSLIATNDNGSDSLSAAIKVVATPEVSLGPDLTICRGQSVTLSASGADRYEWVPQVGITSPKDPVQTLSPETTTQYIVKGWSILDCESLDTINVNVRDRLVAEAGPDVNICLGESTVLQGSGGSTYLWSPADGLSDINSPNPIAAPAQTTMYHLRVGSGDCESRDSVLVEVHLPPVIVTSPDQTICPGDTITLTAAGGQNIRWAESASLSSLSGSSTLAAPGKTETFKVFAINEYGCTDSAEVTINVEAPFDILVDYPDSVCSSSEFKLSASGADEYEWRPQDLFDDPFSPNPTARVGSSQMLTVIGKRGTCKQTVEIPINILPKTSIELNPLYQICAGESVKIEAAGAAAYSWSPATGLDNPNSASPTASPTESTVYTVVGVDVNGCETLAGTTEVRVSNNTEIVVAADNANVTPARPGESRTIVISLSGEQTQIESLDIQSIEFRLNFPVNGLRLGDIINSEQSGWSWEIVNGESGQGGALIRGAGSSRLAGGPLMSLEFTVFQHKFDSLAAKIGISSDIETSDCGRVETHGTSIPLSPLCLNDSRVFQLSGIPFSIKSPEPHPSSGEVEINYSIAINAHTTLEVHNSIGSRVAKLVDNNLVAGYYSESVTGLAPGVYFITLKSGPFFETVTIVVQE